jgi:hypothetical protein
MGVCELNIAMLTSGRVNDRRPETLLYECRRWVKTEHLWPAETEQLPHLRQVSADPRADHRPEVEGFRPAG